MSVGMRAQVVVTAAVQREVDSLIQVSRALTGKREFDKALEINTVATKGCMACNVLSASPGQKTC